MVTVAADINQTHQMKSFNYQFTRRLYGNVLVIRVVGNGDGTVDISLDQPPRPVWTVAGGMGIDGGFGSDWHGFKATRIQALRFAACCYNNLHGFCCGSAGNQPDRPRPVHKWSKMREFKKLGVL